MLLVAELLIRPDVESEVVKATGFSVDFNRTDVEPLFVDDERKSDLVQEELLEVTDEDAYNRKASTVKTAVRNYTKNFSFIILVLVSLIVTSWRVATRHTMQGCISGESMTACVNLLPVFNRKFTAVII